MSNNALFTIEQVDNKLIITVEAVKPETVEPDKVDLSKYKPFPNEYKIEYGIKIKSVKVCEFGGVKNGAIGTIIGDGSNIPKFICDNESDYINGESDYVFEPVSNFAPLDPSDHPDYKPEQPEPMPASAEEIAQWVDDYTKLDITDELIKSINALVQYELNKSKR